MDTNARSVATTGSLGPDSGRGTVEATMVHLVRVVLEEHWTAHTAAKKLLELTDGDRSVLRRVRAKMLRGSEDRTTPVTDRALATLELAIATIPKR